VNASSIAIANASLVFQTPGNQFFGIRPSRDGELNLTILYGSATTAGVTAFGIEYDISAYWEHHRAQCAPAEVLRFRWNVRTVVRE
jgi:hypothetical protein